MIGFIQTLPWHILHGPTCVLSLRVSAAARPLLSVYCYSLNDHLISLMSTTELGPLLTISAYYVSAPIVNYDWLRAHNPSTDEYGSGPAYIELQQVIEVT